MKNKLMNHTLKNGIAIVTIIIATFTAANATGNAWINEFHYDNDGADVGEFVEVFVSSSFTGNLNDIVLLLYNGSDNELYGSNDTFNLGTDFTSGSTISAGTFYTVFPSSIQNGAPDGMVLWDNSGAGSFLDGFSYEGSMGPLGDGPAVGISLADIGISQGSSTPIGSSLYRTGTGTSPGDFTWASGDGTNTAGSLNVGQVIPEPSSIALIGMAALAALGILRKRKS